MRFALIPVLLALAACGDATKVPAEVEPAQKVAVDHSAMDHSTHMGAAGKLNDAQAAYKAVNDRMHAGMADIPADADVAFMSGMLAHHRGAVEMSEVALQHAKDKKARDLANRVIAAQKAEMAEMEAWLKERGVQ